METNFVKPFGAPRMVISHERGKVLGVYDGVQTFDNKYYALLKNGVVTLYDYCHRLRCDNLEDAWVAPNGYYLIKRKDADVWELWKRSDYCVATGEQAAVFYQGGVALVFLKQVGTSEWHYYDVNEHSILPSLRTVCADSIEVYLHDGCLFFILTLGGKTILQRVDSLFWEPEGTVEQMSSFAFLPNGAVAASSQEVTCVKRAECMQVMPAEGEILYVYSNRLNVWFDCEGIVMFSSGVYLARSQEEWSLFLRSRRVQKGIFNLKLMSEFSSSGISLTAVTADKEPMAMFGMHPDNIKFEYGKKRFCIVNGRQMFAIEGAEDTYVI